MDLYFGGAEIPGWRSLLAKEGVEHVSLSYMGLRRRTKFTKPFVLKEKFPDDQRIFLDSGAYTLNNAKEQAYTADEIADMATQYMSLVQLNIDRVTMVSEFDALVLGKEWISGMREDFWDDLPDDVFLPIWHPEFGLDELDNLCQRYARVGVPQTALNGRNLVPLLNGYVQRYGTKLHGIAMTKPEEMAAVRWDSVASTSWISPAKFGDTIVWTGNQLKRYPRDMKQQARKRHRTLFTQIGLDAEEIEDDNPTEVLRLSIWSWKQLAASLERHRSMDDIVTTLGDEGDNDSAENLPALVDNPPKEARNGITTVQERQPEEMQVLPVFGFTKQTEKYTDEAGEAQTREVNIPYMRSASLRQCNTCFLAGKCPAFRPGYNCAYNIPIEVRTKDQVKGLYDSMIEMQAQRVLFMKMAEDMEGGYADPNLSTEMKLLDQFVARKKELESEGFSLRIEAQQSGPGIMSRVFGAQIGEAVRALPAPMDADEVLEAEVVEMSDVPTRQE